MADIIPFHPVQSLTEIGHLSLYERHFRLGVVQAAPRCHLLIRLVPLLPVRLVREGGCFVATVLREFRAGGNFLLEGSPLSSRPHILPWFSKVIARQRHAMTIFIDNGCP